MDNLLAFSVSQEDLMNEFEEYKVGSPVFNNNIKFQQDLRQQFKYVDDNLFAKSLRNPKIAEEMTQEIGNLHFTNDWSFMSFSGVQISKGLSHQ